ncbi:uncharacterized protein LOC112045092 [Bicyclus anynana]|uniref:Uncharacterized protein LOC112045092 n=1 Tax=Bicyclus anynana TaxID=110368 RepID=A0A6J1MVD7_BICAN|nr:uncharacterized protein LOC112045092 [Bicyclus anynana]
MSSLSDDMRLIIEFVKEVEQHPCLYDNKHAEYGIKTAVDEAWREIGKRFKGLTEADLKVKWRSVRSSYTRSFRINKPYYLTKYLDFLIPFTKHMDKSLVKRVKRERESQKENSEDDDDDDNSSVSSGNITIERTKEENDDVDFYDEDDDDDEYEDQNGKIQVSTLPELKVGLNKRVIRKKGSRSQILSQYTKSRLSPHECYLKSLMPDISAMSQRQFFGFRKGILNILGKIKYGDTRNTES